MGNLSFAHVVAVLGLLWASSVEAQYCTDDQLQVDVYNCGTCGRNCHDGTLNTIQTCSTGICQFQGCLPGFYDLDGNQSCEYACVFQSATELCNNVDDDCDGQVDEGVIAPPQTQVCGVSPLASRAECTSAPSAACVNGAWQCTFPAGVCNPTCATATEICDNLDNDCDGQLNENVPTYGTACASDDGIPGGHGLCRTTATMVCNGPNAVVCNAVVASCTSLPGGCTEFCDGLDNDCDGLTDEPFTNKGVNATNFVKPAVTRISATRWIYSYEASRPNATDQSQGRGNGWFTSAPIGSTIDKTPACSEPGSLPWTNLSAAEAEQVCIAMGGALCTASEYQTACQPSASCLWGYAPRGAAGSACASGFNADKYCNLQPSYDANNAQSGDQDGLLTTNDPDLLNCWADWSGLQGNTSNDKIFDLTGNVRELTVNAVGDYRLMGGAYDHRIDSGATCSYNLLRVDAAYKHQDTGFRCCFSADPRN
jgi:hypothetical protein